MEMYTIFEAESFKPWTSERDDPSPSYTKAELKELADEGRLQETIQRRLDSR